MPVDLHAHFDMADPRPVETVLGLGLPPDAEQAVLAGNGERLLGLGKASSSKELVT